MVSDRLHYPEIVINNTIRHFIEMRVTENVCSKQQVSDEQDAPTRIVLPFKDQKSANTVSYQLSDLSPKIDAVVQPVYVSKKIKGSNFEILKKCQNKLDCLIFKMLFILKLKPKQE